MDSWALPSLLDRWGDRREAQGWGFFQVLAILGCTSLRHQDWTVQGVKRKENMFSMEIPVNQIIRSWMKHRRASRCREPHAAEQAFSVALPHCLHFEVLGMGTLDFNEEITTGIPETSFLRFQLPPTGVRFSKGLPLHQLGQDSNSAVNVPSWFDPTYSVHVSWRQCCTSEPGPEGSARAGEVCWCFIPGGIISSTATEHPFSSSVKAGARNISKIQFWPWTHIQVGRLHSKLLTSSILDNLSYYILTAGMEIRVWS